ncbi:hypothetical protein ASF60_21780 [Methylobacterium sp. Leaf113]|nr:hypothetical protein ASF60_21780 [Methylobacterium sp. Leaf113]
MITVPGCWIVKRWIKDLFELANSIPISLNLRMDLIQTRVFGCKVAINDQTAAHEFRCLQRSQVGNHPVFRRDRVSIGT